ncbi:DNA topoisomerase IB [Winogradskyella bathintestinalis]|uniref:DNA topoisomerase n=1 Tax=Winogradskyella bathintestinalis TaxID=3035208 RepID=A0ABT7ZU72_9FLAO|nr:DNA topoisomerase IB [Winogradskyella bathintestinalis]MDN3492571.1 DNA topoisomerase IB [Winogradskyella bathintestinalis]
MMYYRRKHGRGFRYVDDSNQTIKDKKLKLWFKSLVIPPAWTDVEISAKKNAKILVVGRDDKNRKQYIYNPKFREKQNQEKFDRIVKFADNIEHMRRVTGQHLRKRKLSKEKVLACMVRLLEAAYFRPGNDYYAKENSSYGLTTMRSKHLQIEGEELVFSYKGKSGKAQERHIVDKKLAKIVKEIDDLPGYEIFKFIDEAGVKHDVKSDHLNNYIKEIMGEEFSTKDFRTWAGTVIAALALDEIGLSKEQDQKELDNNIREAVIKVSERLGNTPSVARSSYIDPRVIDEYIDGKTINYFQKEISRLLKVNENLSREEIGVLCMLKKKLN